MNKLMKYYAERNSLIDEELNICFEELREYFVKVYRYFENKVCFEAATRGIWIRPQWGDEYQAIPPLFAPAPEIFFMNHLHSTRIYPIFEYYTYYTEVQFFTVIEILYDKISIYDYQENVLKTDEVKKEFATQINNLLQFYDGGYYLEPNSGTIVKGVNDSLKIMLTEDLKKIPSEDIMSQMRTAVKLYYRFDSDLEMKKKAINIMADILEPLRSDLKDILNAKLEINKNDHDKLIFEIVNGFNIRHNNSKQKTNYEHEVWYDWMMQYYTSVIITYFKLKSIKE
jgi:hypothetical protein